MLTYRQRPEIAQSDIKNLLESYSLFKYKRENPTESTPAQLFGTALHTAILEPDVFFKTYAFFDGDKRKKEDKAYYDELTAENKIIVSSKEYNLLLDMKNAFDKSDVANLLINGIVEKEIYFVFDGVQCKAKPDLINLEYQTVIDLKTCADTSEKACLNAIANYKYYIQDAFYSLAVEKEFGIFAPKFLFVFIDKNPPHLIRIVELDYDWHDVAKSQINAAFDALKAKDETTIYYSNLALPSWIKKCII